MKENKQNKILIIVGIILGVIGTLGNMGIINNDRFLSNGRNNRVVKGKNSIPVNVDINIKDL